MFEINFIYHLLSLTPQIIRKPLNIAWKLLMLSGLKSIHDEFLAYRNEVNRRAAYTGQVMVLERMLNLQYSRDIDGLPVDIWASPGDPTAGGNIWIEQVTGIIPVNYTWYDSEGQDPVYTFYEGEPNPNQYYTYYESEYYSQTAFIIRVPSTLVYTPEEMRSRIDRYLNAGYNYTIQIY